MTLVMKLETGDAPAVVRVYDNGQFAGVIRVPPASTQTINGTGTRTFEVRELAPTIAEAAQVPEPVFDTEGELVPIEVALGYTAVGAHHVAELMRVVGDARPGEDRIGTVAVERQSWDNSGRSGPTVVG